MKQKMVLLVCLQETLPEGRDFEGARRAALGAISIGGAFAAFRVGAFFVVNGYVP